MCDEWAISRKITESGIANNAEMDQGRQTPAIISFCSNFLIRNCRLGH